MVITAALGTALLWYVWVGQRQGRTHLGHVRMFEDEGYPQYARALVWAGYISDALVVLMIGFVLSSRLAL